MDIESRDPGMDPSVGSPAQSSRKPRLFIKEMVLRNFKSYAGEQRPGPFHGMRLNKVAELIHHSSNHQNLESAGVSVHFQEIIYLDDGTYKAVEGSDFVITRVAFRDNSSKYYINDRGSNFTDVTKKLKAKGVDLYKNRFLILQEVEYILEDDPKCNFGICLEFLNEKRTAVVQMVKLAENERDGLEELDTDMRTCKEQFKEFERQDVKYREDLKHLKQKIKEIENKLEKEYEKSSNLIPNLEQEIPKVQQLLMDEEKILEELKESSKDETERHRSELMVVRVELEPWENQLIGHEGKLDVACAESELLKEKMGIALF
ncbi:putative Structural maintenance of chromosomes protein 4 [Cocos nucifera]|uniref:Putative Structural maintenance of chromosomes protein 4 n=1 Tax=Cocos nucifera TaxID=13894 RepID=A0A8K0INA2_COCNU|nr:putative Structural maintenance of chromosomes protein 4 [Cocos nucifera]